MTMAHFFGTEGKFEQSCIIRSKANKTSSHDTDSQLFTLRLATRLNCAGNDEMTHES